MLCLFGYACLVLFLLKVFQKWTIGWDDSNTCLIGKTAIVTGGKRGIGYETALKLASRGCKVIIADVLNSEESVKDIKEQTNNQDVTYKFLDLSSFKSIRKFADEINRNEKRLDILINNAGIAGFEGVYTDDGLLKPHQINYFGPFLLTHLLTGILKKTPDSRIVFVVSLLAFIHNISSIDDVNKPAKTKYKFLEAGIDYSNNKVCAIIAARIFAKKLTKYEVSCVSVHPGTISTAIYKTNFDNRAAFSVLNLNRALNSLLMKIYGKTQVEAVQTTLYCALSPYVKESIGGFYVDCKQFCLPSLAKKEKFCDKLWMESERLTGLKSNEKLE